ncbi:MAG: tetratricopeptide repeat protein [Spirochaetes bacterium]|nr:tetratricopeptide repeat protein [Spirochaetota bacterium]
MMVQKIIITALVVCFSVIGGANQWHDEADRYWNEAQKYKKDRNYKQVIEYLKRAVTAERKNEIPRTEELIAQLNELGQTYDVLGDYNKSLHYYKLMLSTCRKYKVADQEAMAGNSIGQAYFHLDRFDEAMASYREALEISRKNAFKDRMVLVLNNMALAHRVQKDFIGARECYDEALKYARESKIGDNMAVTTSNAGTMYYFMKEYDRALELYSEALAIDRLRGSDEYLSVDLSNIGSVYAALGRYGEALNYFEKALEIDGRYKNEKNMASRYYRIGDIYFMVGDNTRAVVFYNKSLEINLKLNNTMNAARIQNSIGQVFDSMGKYEKALDYYVKALALNKDIELQENIALRLSDIGLLYEIRERYGEAVDYIEKALQRDKAAEKKNRIADNLSNLGRVMVSLKRHEKALEYFNQAMEMYRELNDTVSLADDSKNCGIVHYNMKEYEKAIELFEKARQIIESGTKKQGFSITDVRSDIYRWLIASYAKADKPEKAYEANELFCIGKIKSVLPDSALPLQTKSVSYDKLKKEIGDKTALVILANILWDNPFLIYIDSETAMTYELDKAATVNTLYNLLGKEIERFVGKKKTDIIFKISQKSRKDYYYIEFEKIINYYRSLLSKKYISGSEYAIQRSISKVLYQFIFQKIERNISGKDTLIIQPDGVLSTVPFETLATPDGRFLIEKAGIKYTFSQTCDAYFSERLYGAGRKTMLLVNGINASPNPSEKNIESSRHFEVIVEGINNKLLEHKSLLEMYGFFSVNDLSGLKSSTAEMNSLKAIAKDGDVITGDRVTETALTAMARAGSLATYRIIHILSRGIIIPEVPQLSSLLVSYKKDEEGGKDGILTVRKIASLGIRSDVVHISSVTIPMAGYSRGEGLWHLCGSFMAAGSRGVSLSLWEVDEAERSYFMKQVYEAAINKNVPFEGAFTQAKRTFIQGKIDQNSAVSTAAEGESGMKKSNPYFWGSFIYYGR